MNFKCLFGHQWNGCKCERCGKTRPHQPEGTVCKNCGKKISTMPFTEDERKQLGWTASMGYSYIKDIGDIYFNTQYYSIEALLSVRDFLTKAVLSEGFKERTGIDGINLIRKINEIEKEI